MTNLWQDLRYAVRVLAKSPGFTAVAVLTNEIRNDVRICVGLEEANVCCIPVARPGQHVSLRTHVGSRIIAVFTILLACASFAQAASDVQTFALGDTRDMILLNVKADAVEYKGRKAVRLTKDTAKDGFALLRTSDFQDGTIEADIALKITTPAGVRMPGFVGIAFRARADGSRYELFYLRPGNAGSDDQAMRNHSVQYVSEPDFDWYKLRREWPWVYEAYAELQTETWTHVRIEVKGRSAELYLNGLASPSLVVDGLKGEDLRGGVALWSSQGEEAYFKCSYH